MPSVEGVVSVLGALPGVFLLNSVKRVKSRIVLAVRDCLFSGKEFFKDLVDAA